MKTDIDIICAQTGSSPEEATRLLQEAGGDVTQAVMLFYEPDKDRSYDYQRSFTLEVPTQIHELRGMLNKADEAIQRMGGEKETMTKIVNVLQQYQAQQTELTHEQHEQLMEQQRDPLEQMDQNTIP